MTRDDLIAFEERVADLFNDGKIPYPVHLSDGNEDAIIRAFANIATDDWVCGSWRMHYQCLMHGVSEEDLLAAIYRGESMTLCFPERGIVSSAIVGGILPIATGIALGIKQRGGLEKVHCWLGDMTARTGIFHECAEYARGYDLPIIYYVEENGLSVCTPTHAAWGHERGWSDVVRYRYNSKWPHAGAGQRVQF